MSAGVMPDFHYHQQTQSLANVGITWGSYKHTCIFVLTLPYDTIENQLIHMSQLTMSSKMRSDRYHFTSISNSLPQSNQYICIPPYTICYLTIPHVQAIV